jgi:large conductance mechanosensitive channel
MAGLDEARMLSDFREFLLKQNALALAVGVIIGAAIGRVVQSIVNDLLMPVIGMGMPGGDWRSARIVLAETVGKDGQPVVSAINYGTFLGTVIDFVIVAFVIFMILRVAIKPDAPSATKACPFCGETVPVAATRCRACTSALT